MAHSAQIAAIPASQNKHPNTNKFVSLLPTPPAAWNDSAQAWDVDFVSGGKKSEGTFDHLVVANGHYAYPKIPTWEGTGEWLEGGEREVLHSLWYRGAEQLRGKTVLVVGFGASGWDIVRHSQEYADEVYHSYDAYAPGTPGKLPAIPGAIWKPRISHFTPSSIVFTDGSTLSSEKVTVFLATGYENLIPFLRDLSYAPIDPKVPVRSLTTNGSYITPIHADLFAADASIPTNRLAVVGLPWYTAVGGTSYIQGLAVGHAIAEEGFLPGLEEIWRELEEKERRVREQGKEPTKIGHNFINPGDAEAYQDSLLLSIRSRSSIALPSWLSDPNTPYIEDWRRYWRANGVKLGITYAKAVESGLGGEKRFTSETGTQEDWVRAMEELERWGEENVWNQ
ncbi:FAD/NAD P-binding domain-containing protein [Pseudohyphozyma bogoriensis]|nr:FAD/NAD P-binding domain-containing protein [Pseudohyphozyma bogoriensis]